MKDMWCTMDSTPLQTNEQVLALQFISTAHRNLHDQRRKSETRAFFTALTFFAIVGAARFTSTGVIPDPLPCGMRVTVWVLVMFVALISGVYLCVLHRSNQVNKDIAHHAETEIQRILQEHGITPVKSRKPPCPYSALACQVSVIFALAVASAISLTRLNSKPDKPDAPRPVSLSILNLSL
jgi:hypothetical protein